VNQAPSVYVLLGLTALVGGLAGLMTFALLRFISAIRAARAPQRGGAELVLASALEDAVTRLKAQERAASARADATERLSGEIVNSLTAGLLVVGLDGSVQILNPAGRRLLGAHDESIGQHYRRVLVEPALARTIEECLTSGQAIVRRTIARPGGSQASSFGVTVSPLHDQAGRLHGVVCLFTDLTAIQRLEEQLRLKEGLATLGELTAGIAHEFRNGLATIHGYSGLIDRQQVPEPYRAYVDGIRDEAESLREIVTNFLNFARPAELTLTDVDMEMICERAAEELRADARSLAGDIAVGGEFGEVRGDEVLLRQAFSNLVRNAIQACANASIAPRVEIVGAIADGFATIRVDDNGPGIDAALREKIFQPFFTSKRGGTGLGLALVQKIVVFHNGRVTVDTSPSGGASLQVTLPTA
jgi:PAS domain S-box-containing protein